MQLNKETMRKIVYYLARGYNRSEVAQNVGVHRTTVHYYVRALRNKTLAINKRKQGPQ